MLSPPNTSTRKSLTLRTSLPRIPSKLRLSWTSDEITDSVYASREVASHGEGTRLNAERVVLASKNVAFDDEEIPRTAVIVRLRKPLIKSVAHIPSKLRLS